MKVDSSMAFLLNGLTLFEKIALLSNEKHEKEMLKTNIHNSLRLL